MGTTRPQRRAGRSGQATLAWSHCTSYWGLVFPLGMYGAATFKMRGVIDLAPLDWLPKLTLAVAVVAWSTAFLGLVWQGTRGTLNRR